MNLQELDRLIKKYYDGSSSDIEEERLLSLISSSDLPPEYDVERELLFGLMDTRSIPEPDSGFESRILTAIDDSEKDSRIISIKRRIYSVVSVAATLLIIFTSYLLLRNTGEPEDTFDDPVLAYNATIEVLGRIGETLNTGSDVISELALISKAEQKLGMLAEPVRMVSREMESLKYIEQSLDILDIGN
jgi:hypothetical protein